MGQSPIEMHRTLTEEALAAGNIDALLALHKSIFGGWRMADEGDAGEGDGGDPDGEDGSGDGDDGGADDPKDKAKLDPKIKELHDENSRRRNENKQLAKEKADLAAKLKQFEDADKSETERLTSERDELKTKTEKLAATNTKLALQVAFLQDNQFTWHNPKAALRLLDLDGVKIDDDGEVEGLSEAIKALAKENPYLLKDKGNDSDEDSESGAPRNASGQAVSKAAQKKRTDLEKKYRLGV